MPGITGHRTRERIGGLGQRTEIRPRQAKPIPGLGIPCPAAAEPLQEIPRYLPVPGTERGGCGGFQGLQVLLIGGRHSVEVQVIKGIVSNLNKDNILARSIALRNANVFMKFLFEISKTPIYQRIIEGFSAALQQLGHDTLLVDPGNYSSAGNYLRAIWAGNADCCVLTNSLSPLALLSSDGERFLFEFTDRRLIFIHHDSIAVAGFASDHAFIRKRLAAYRRVAERSRHFCIESSNLRDLKTLGAANAYPILHASEFAAAPSPHNYRHEVSFVGHIMPPPEGDYFDDAPINALLRRRVERLDEPIGPAATAHADKLHPDARHDIGWLAARHSFLSGIHQASQAFRGDVIDRMKDFPLDVFGGDPGYLNAMNSTSTIHKPGLRYHGPTPAYSATANIYARSKISLNITSLQFDTAVINRVIDVAAAGGFVLTDWKADLQRLTSVHDEISYRTVDELNGKIEYYLVNEKERRDIAAQLHRDITEKCRYQHVMQYLLDTLQHEPAQ